MAPPAAGPLRGGGFFAASGVRGQSWDKPPPIRAITRGPKFHWFGYYDKLEFDPTGRYVLGMEVDFEGRSPKPDDVIRVGMVDLEGRRPLDRAGQDPAWCWQQGCMLQWRPGSKSEVVWNDRDGDQFVCHVLDVFSGKKRTVPHPVYALSPDGRWAVAADFRRINDMRPGYGYGGVPDPNADVLAPADSGIFRVDLESGEASCSFRWPTSPRSPSPARRPAFNGPEALVQPPAGQPRRQPLRVPAPLADARGPRRLRHARCSPPRPTGADLRVIDPSGYTSHFIWRDPAAHPRLGVAPVTRRTGSTCSRTRPATSRRSART